MKIVLISIIVFAFIPASELVFEENGIPEIENLIKSECVLSEGNMELCTCIAAGGCVYEQGGSCRIEFCSGAVINEPTNRRTGEITTIQQLCPPEEGL